MSNEDALLAYCRTREMLKRQERITKESRAEQADAKRTLGGLLAESMQRNSLQCMPAPSGEGFVTLSKPTQKPCKLATEADVLSLLDGLGRAVEDVPAERLPGAIVRIVHERAKLRAKGQQGSEAPTPRVCVTKAPVGPVHNGPLPAETKTLAAQFTDAIQERAQSISEMKPLRTAFQSAEKVLMPFLDGQTSGTVRLEVDGRSKVLKVSKVSTPHPSSAKRLGIRRVLKLLREAAGEVCEETRADLEKRIREALLRKLRTASPAAEVKSRLKVVTLRVP